MSDTINDETMSRLTELEKQVIQLAADMQQLKERQEREFAANNAVVEKAQQQLKDIDNDRKDT